MQKQNITFYPDINWTTLWQNAREQKSWSTKKSADWDKKAGSFASRNASSPYVSLFLSNLDLDPAMSVLDVGAGPGTLAIPLAQEVKTVTAVDYSPEMLAQLQRLALEKGITNIKTIQGAWEDDWHALEIKKHDIAIASRSLGVADLTTALIKLNSHARHYVFISDRISPTPFDPAAFAAIGRPFESGPDYIHTINSLYSIGIHANVRIISLEQEQQFANITKAVESYTWMFKDLQDQEKNKLETYIQSKIIHSTDDAITIIRSPAPCWALIWWQPDRN